MPEDEEIRDRFKFHEPDTDRKAQDHDKVRLACQGLAVYLNNLVPEGREKSLAITKVEEAMFWANAGLARRRG